MAKLSFTQQLARFTTAPEIQTNAPNLRLALEDAFIQHPHLRSYILDDQGHLRQHVVIFMDGRRVIDRGGLQDVVLADSQIHVLQALSGG